MVKESKVIPFDNILVKCLTMEGKKQIIVVPEQGLEPSFITNAPVDSLEIDKYYRVSITKEDKGYASVSDFVIVNGKPTPAEVASSKKNVEGVYSKIKEQEELEKVKKEEEFKLSNGIPPIPKDLYINAKIWNMVSASVHLDKYVILLGPKGCGKTETAKQLGVATKMNFVSFNMGAAFKPKQMFAGMLQAKDGDTIFIESEFLKAFQATEPTMIFLDEITRTPQVATNYLMTILDRNQSYIYIEELGKRVYKGSGVKFICAGNVGTQYTDTRTLDGAFWDRFIKIPVDYLPKAEEEKLIMARAPKANKKTVSELINRAQKCREAELSGSLSSGISSRQLIDMAHYLEIGFTLEEVFENIFLNNFINGNNNEVETVKGVVQS
jgi:hypothetical protein